MKKRSARRRAVLLTLVVLGASTVNGGGSGSGIAVATTAEVGEWGSPFWEGDNESPPIPYGELPITDEEQAREKGRMFPAAAHIALLTNGKVLYWNGLEGSEDTGLTTGGAYGQVAKNARARVLDLSGPGPAWSKPDPERGYEGPDGDHSKHNMFCADQKLLYNGTLLIAGGESRDLEDTYGIAETRVFTPSTQKFANVGDMAEKRWYPSLVTLPSGKVLVLTGTRRMFVPQASDHVHAGDPANVNSLAAINNVLLPEIYDPATGRWTSRQLQAKSLPLYARAHLMPNGKVFYPGAGNGWGGGGQTADQFGWNEQRLYDPVSDTWKVAGIAQYGFREPTTALFRLESPYTTAKVLLAGGTLYPSGIPPLANTLSEVVTVQGDTVSNDGNVKSPVAGAGPVGDPTQLRNARWASTPVVLPTGEVILFNGGDTQETSAPGSEGAVRMAELYDPATNTWRNLSSDKRERTYHNSALLLPDGRILVGGHAPVRVRDASMSRSNSVRDATFEIYSPPYLFRGDRPAIERLTVHPQELDIKVRGKSSDIAKVVAVRYGANTHSIDADQRAVSLPFVPGNDGALTAHLPSHDAPGVANGNILPPGPYHIFVIQNTDNGPVPSVARAVMAVPSGDGQVIFAPVP